MIQMHVHAGPFFDYFFFRMGVTIVVVKIKGGGASYIGLDKYNTFYYLFIIFYIDLCDVL